MLAAGYQDVEGVPAVSYGDRLRVEAAPNLQVLKKAPISL
jgi:hypothetical protein